MFDWASFLMGVGAVYALRWLGRGALWLWWRYEQHTLTRWWYSR